ncbi:hypothetical protein DAPPUDRAFT_330099 [Daphnia pulex]|uniref:SNF2 N-terminal domain-containing protein n=1 Tax=Daphnia pulex TaxID=6669 RepID=E9HIJ2_DAPPU|nr:hypothetical protein DAPPUDRAFT_330099 [Daphnia pulex]|eukprot:EFX68437.1 hypothetical protein DAPPUDRAFT_330099 [Daphnia pulex]
MGLGKSLCIIALIAKHKETLTALSNTPSVQLPKWIKQSSGTLIVCPASVLGQRKLELEKHCKALTVATFHGKG